MNQGGTNAKLIPCPLLIYQMSHMNDCGSILAHFGTIHINIDALGCVSQNTYIKTI